MPALQPITDLTESEEEPKTTPTTRKRPAADLPKPKKKAKSADQLVEPEEGAAESAKGPKKGAPKPKAKAKGKAASKRPAASPSKEKASGQTETGAAEGEAADADGDEAKVDDDKKQAGVASLTAWLVQRVTMLV